jgi:uncharacterized membrane protein YsdA (DUF1294 family)
MKLFLLYWLAISVVSSLITILDKRAAQRHAMRVPEIVLLLFAALGGCVGMYITMLVIRHKTKHPQFVFGVPAILLLQTAVAVCVILFTSRMH